MRAKERKRKSAKERRRAQKGAKVPKSALFYRVKDTAHSLESGSFRMDLSTKFGKAIPSRDLRDNKVSFTSMTQGFPKGSFCEGGQSQLLGWGGHRLK